MKRRLSEAAVVEIMEHLLERFGDPIGGTVTDRQAVADQRGGKPKKGGTPKSSNRGFGAKLEVAPPAACDQCGGMMGMDEVACTNCGAMPGQCIDTEEPKASPLKIAPAAAPGEEMSTSLIVVGGHANPRGTQPGASAKGISPSVHPPQFMDDIPETGSGRQVPKRQAVSGPMPATMDEDDAPAASGAKPMPTPPKPAPPKVAAPPVPSSGGSPPGGMDEEEMPAELDEKAPPGRERQVRALKKAKGVKNPFAVAWSSYDKSHGDE